MNRHTISLCMIVKDEERYIDRCLASAAAHVDEIIIVDTGSKDGTLEIVKQYGAKIHPFQWVDDFSAARNYGLQQATGDYILILDADEYLDESSDLQQDIASGHDSYAMEFRNYLTNGMVVHHAAIRLIKNHIGLSYYGRIHEHLNVEQLGVSNGQAQSLVHHDGYRHETYEDKDKHERNLKLLIKAVEEDPSGYNLFNLGTQYKQADRHEDAVRTFQRAYSMNKDKIYSISLIYSLVDSLRELKRYQDALNVVADAIVAFPKITDFHYVQGTVYQAAGHWPDAIQCYKKCLEMGDVKMDFTFPTFAGVGSFLAHHRLGETYAQMGRKADALEEAFHALQQNRGYLPVLRFYLTLMLEAHIPLDQAFDNLQSVYPMTELKDLQALLSALYSIRHPLMDRYLSEFQPPVDRYVEATAKQVIGQHEASREIWRGMESIKEHSVPDVILLAIQLRDESLLSLVKQSANYSKREWQVIRHAVTREGAPGTMTDDLAALFLTLCTNVIVQQDYEGFEWLSGFVVKGSVQARFDLAKLLVTYGFTDVAFELLADLFEQQPMHVDVLCLLGEVCLLHDRFGDALNLFLRAMELKPDYRSAYNLYRFYEKTQDAEGMRKILADMQRRFPESNWARQHVAGQPVRI